MARKGRATYQDLLNLPDNVVGEILAGELVVSPRPSVPHEAAFPGGWHVAFEPELHLHGDVVVPDLAGWRQERMPQPPRKAAIELPPDWVCEVVSARTRRHDRGAKAAIYAREGVRHFDAVELDLSRWWLPEEEPPP